ncbi:MAG: DUF1629 domain-containing protein [Phycisphaerales bacterium]
MKRETPFWHWSNWKGAGSSHESARTHITFDRADYELLRRISHADSLIDPVRSVPFVADIEYRKSIDDCPWPIYGPFVVSERVRVVLEQESPGNCRYYPIQLRHEGIDLDLKYWVLHVLHTVDCLDRTRTHFLPSGGVVRPVIIQSRVPSNVCIFRIVDDFYILYIGNRLRLALQRMKTTGCTYTKIETVP